MISCVRFFSKSGFGLTNLISFCDNVTSIVDGGRAVDLINLVVSSAIPLFPIN